MRSLSAFSHDRLT